MSFLSVHTCDDFPVHNNAAQAEPAQQLTVNFCLEPALVTFPARGNARTLRNSVQQ
jgi:hypothetical protein